MLRREDLNYPTILRIRRDRPHDIANLTKLRAYLPTARSTMLPAGMWEEGEVTLPLVLRCANQPQRYWATAAAGFLAGGGVDFGFQNGSALIQESSA